MNARHACTRFSKIDCQFVFTYLYIWHNYNVEGSGYALHSARGAFVSSSLTDVASVSQNRMVGNMVLLPAARFHWVFSLCDVLEFQVRPIADVP